MNHQQIRSGKAKKIHMIAQNSALAIMFVLIIFDF